MNREHTGGPAFPMPMTMMTAEHIANEPEYGMTLRDYFAAKATEEDIKAHMQVKKTTTVSYFTREQAKYRYADAMLKAREE